MLPLEPRRQGKPRYQVLVQTAYPEQFQHPDLRQREHKSSRMRYTSTYPWLLFARPIPSSNLLPVWGSCLLPPGNCTCCIYQGLRPMPSRPLIQKPRDRLQRMSRNRCMFPDQRQVFSWYVSLRVLANYQHFFPLSIASSCAESAAGLVSVMFTSDE
jgi:hypothetical protein